MELFGRAKKKDVEPIELKAILSAEEVAGLVTELRTAANRVPGETSAMMSAMAKIIEEGAAMPFQQGLDLCISAINMNEAFHEAKSGSRDLVKKLESIRKQG